MWRIVRQAAVTVAFLAATSLIASAQNGSTVRAGGHAPDAVSAGGPAAGTSPGDSALQAPDVPTGVGSLMPCRPGPPYISLPCRPATKSRPPLPRPGS